ncbi:MULTISPECIES: glucose 1-dehydrogenase [unclassified Paenibacillus]|uniref:SDR family NAD(P)-dependent oxidoreductase n=1 Tax=unclassified Paenibacillus TaxID=185978 RepID=UPI0009561CB3|nr:MULTISPECIES: glucose 1-dehydrogenase [unclassified Paenibacillus]ASS67551.1 glucose 1-dehydrogenase [Paenibacillus sp. RUD330]SIQ73079.1 NAD(P)-dependent dehydrogenase, short-chain alcohol dehydrogenase family [Paenibacillus sp. RU4X]SIQ94493.1 NAD(P)-dependent dehydrogenase, short-chain alcohol dehydrogenase family [Paenibacillus sp. RU4T]
MLDRKIAVVTGAGSGIGRATSLKMAGYGAKLVVVDFNEATGQETVRLIQEQGGEAIFVQADVSKAEDVQRYVQAALEAFGRIDVFFNNAGVVQKFSKLADIEESEFDRIMSVNVRGVFLGMKYVLQVMEKQESGAIINTASTAGVKSEHSASAYSASKHAVVGLTKGAAMEYVKKGIRVNGICPGGVETALTKGVEQAFMSGGYVPEEVANMRMGRYAQPEELAEVVCFLASDRASYMTGSIVLADGGLTL